MSDGTKEVWLFIGWMGGTFATYLSWEWAIPVAAITIIIAYSFDALYRYTPKGQQRLEKYTKEQKRNP